MRGTMLMPRPASTRACTVSMPPLLRRRSWERIPRRSRKSRTMVRKPWPLFMTMSGSSAQSFDGHRAVSGQPVIGGYRDQQRLAEQRKGTQIFEAPPPPASSTSARSTSPSPQRRDPAAARIPPAAARSVPGAVAGRPSAAAAASRPPSWEGSPASPRPASRPPSNSARSRRLSLKLTQGFLERGARNNRAPRRQPGARTVTFQQGSPGLVFQLGDLNGQRRAARRDTCRPQRVNEPVSTTATK